MKSTIAIGIILFLSFMFGGCLVDFFADVDVDEILSDTHIQEVDLQTVDPGTYTGRHSAGLVEVVLQVTVQNHEITAIQIREHDNWRGKKAECITDEVIWTQSVLVDAVSGATISSMVILKSIENALREGMQEEQQQ